MFSAINRIAQDSVDEVYRRVARLAAETANNPAFMKMSGSESLRKFAELLRAVANAEKT